MYMYSRRHTNGDVSLPFRKNGTCSVPFTTPFPFHVRKQPINTLDVSYPAHSLSTRIDTSTLLWHSKLRWDAVLLPLFKPGFLWSQLDLEQISLSTIDWLIKYHQLNPIASQMNRSIDWNSTLFTFVGLSSSLVWANDSSRRSSHHLSLYSAPVLSPFSVEQNGHSFLFLQTGTEQKRHCFYASYCTTVIKSYNSFNYLIPYCILINRFSKHNILLGGLWYSIKKPTLSTFLYSSIAALNSLF